MKKREIFAASFIFVLLVIITTQSTLGLMDKKIKNIMLDKKDMPGFSLVQDITLAQVWPVVKSIPDYMQNPENPTVTGKIMDFKNPDKTLVTQEITRKDAARQKWETSDLEYRWVTIDYGYYDSPQVARNSLKYIVYQKLAVIPLATPHPNKGYPQVPGILPGQHPHDGQFRPTCRKLDYGDLSYFVNNPTGRGSVYVAKGRYIFMVDSNQQSVENNVIKMILAKIEKMGP
jgi:hypothetical protein